MGDIFERFKVIGIDSRIPEPPAVWTSRVASKWKDKVPLVRRLEGRDVWPIDGIADEFLQKVLTDNAAKLYEVGV